MTDRSIATSVGVFVGGDQPLIGVPVHVNGREAVRYFANEAEADAALSQSDVDAALSAIGAWGDLDYEATQAALEHIRHETPPTPPIEEL